MKNKVMKFPMSGKVLILVSIQVVLYIVAFFTFFLGLGVGLAVNPMIGNVLVLGAFVIAGLNTLWLVKSFAKTRKK